MKWVSHQAMAVMGSFVLGMPLAGIAAAWAGSVVPDILDQREAGKALGSTFGGRFGKTLGGNLGASLGRGIIGTLFKN
ncbi:MAG: hypothetical protein IKL39_05280 [Mailhella sp.]|nr:hypothetical protein [Mailhella sp.]